MSLADRNKSILERVDRHAEHPSANALRKAAENCLAVSERFARERDLIAQNGHLTQEGVRAQLTEALRRTYDRDLRDARKPFDAAAAKLKSMREQVKPAQVDRTDVVAALERQEIRAFVRGLNVQERTKLLTPGSDPRVLDAVLDAPAALSGVPEPYFAQVKAWREEQLHGPLLKEIADLDSLLSESQNAAVIARGDLMNTMQIDQRGFDRIMLPIENKADAPWLKKEGDAVVVVVPGQATYQPATADEMRDGVFFESAEAFFKAHGVKDQAEYLARRAA